jgi:hypothetical protein
MEQIVIPQVTENDDAGLLVKQGQRALHEEGNLHASRHWFDRAFRAAERDGDLEAMGQAAIGLSGLWVYEHHSTEPWAQVLSRQRQTLDLLPPGSLLSLQLRARLAAEADYQAGRSSQIFAVLAEARHREDPHILATTLCSGPSTAGYARRWPTSCC